MILAALALAFSSPAHAETYAVELAREAARRGVSAICERPLSFQEFEARMVGADTATLGALERVVGYRAVDTACSPAVRLRILHAMMAVRSKIDSCVRTLNPGIANRLDAKLDGQFRISCSHTQGIGGHARENSSELNLNVAPGISTPLDARIFHELLHTTEGPRHRLSSRDHNNGFSADVVYGCQFACFAHTNYDDVNRFGANIAKATRLPRLSPAQEAAIHHYAGTGYSAVPDATRASLNATTQLGARACALGSVPPVRP